jgi:carotenoid cleavage dioxygenase-like enzyme
VLIFAPIPTVDDVCIRTGTVVRTISSTEGAWFVYHVLNAYENDAGGIVIDFSKYHNSSLITNGMFLNDIIDHPTQYVPT